MFGDEIFPLNFTTFDEKSTLVEKICRSGIVYRVAARCDFSWDELIREMVCSKKILHAYCGLFGMETESLTQRLLQKVSDNLSTIFIFPGDPPARRSRKQNNDIRLNTYSETRLFGAEESLLTIPDFQTTLDDPRVRRNFWGIYTPGTGRFAVSTSNLDHLIDEEEYCPICLYPFVATAPGIKLLPCAHAIHVSCARMLFLTGGDLPVICPLCRARVVDLG